MELAFEGLHNSGARLFSPSESHAKRHTSSSLCPTPSGPGLRWRPWPCATCSGGITPIGQLFRSGEAGAVLSATSPEEVAVKQIAALKRWIASCSHTVETEIPFPKLDEGSEHLVFLDADNATVFKATHPNIFGESYYLDPAGTICQKNCSLLEYLIRLRLWKKLFQSAPRDLGMTDQGQIVSSHKFITGTKPTQAAVDSFLAEAGLSAVRQEYWLWKKTYRNFDIWLGDARDDNFVETEVGIVPIDIRLWFSGSMPVAESIVWFRASA